MQNLKILNSKETKRILDVMKEQWGFDSDMDYVFLMSPKDKIYIINRDIEFINDKKLRIDSLGLYFGELKDGEMRVSIEGSQIIGNHIKKNFIELDEEEMRLWLKGKDLEKKTELRGFVIMKHNNDFLGTGRTAEGRITNFVPKTRRILAD